MRSVSVHPPTDRQDKMPLSPVAGGAGMGIPLDAGTGRGVMPRARIYDRFEKRTYNGVSAAVLSDHAEDLWGQFHNGPRRDGSARRYIERMSGIMQTALWAYLVVKNALGLLASPLRPSSFKSCLRKTPRAATPKAPIIWLTPPPTQAVWAARDSAAAYDIRGTSPTWVMRRVHRYRARRRRALELPFERVDRLRRTKARAGTGTKDFIGPPTPRHYQDVADIGLTWPPVPRPGPPKAILPPLNDAEVVLREMCEDISADTRDTAETLIAGYNYALEQFGEAGTQAFLRTLHPLQTAFMDAYIKANRAAHEGAGRGFAAAPAKAPEPATRAPPRRG